MSLESIMNLERTKMISINLSINIITWFLTLHEYSIAGILCQASIRTYVAKLDIYIHEVHTYVQITRRKIPNLDVQIIMHHSNDISVDPLMNMS